MSDGLHEHPSHDAVGRTLYQLHGKASPDAVAHEEELVNAKVVHQPQLVVGESAHRSSIGIGPLDSPPLAFLWSMVMQRNSLLKMSMALNTAVGQLLTREFRPPPGVTKSGKPNPATSYRILTSPFS
jgi:hypothetical protein